MDKRNEILNTELGKWVNEKGVSSIYPKSFPEAYKEAAINAMDEHAAEWKKKYEEANQFICDLGKLIALDGLGYDDMKASIEDFRDAIDEKKKEFCLQLLEYMAKNKVECGIDKKGEMIFWYAGEWLSKEQLFENFL